MNDIAVYVEDLARKAKAASRSLGFASDEARCAAVRAMATALRQRADEVLEANAIDMDAARAAGTSEGLLDRLLLTPERVEGMAAGLDKLADLPDPVGRVLDERDISEGVHLRRVSVPLGLVAMVYEARPNVTADAAGICIRTATPAFCAEVPSLRTAVSQSPASWRMPSRRVDSTGRRFPSSRRPIALQRGRSWRCAAWLMF